MRKGIIIVLVLVLMASSVHAWGVAYTQDNFVIDSGNTQEVKFNLQKYAGDTSQRIVVELEGNADIASITDKKEYYPLPPKTKDHEVVVKLNIPKPARKSYSVKVNFIALSSDEVIDITNAKTITLNIEVPDGTLQNGLAGENEIDLNEKEANENIGLDEGSDNKITGLAFSEEGASISIETFLIVFAFIFIVTLASFFIVSKKRGEIGL